jgi:ATP-dependent DNA helicase RecG
VTVLPGVGKNYAKVLSRLSIYTLRDLLYYFPRTYIDYSALKPINRLRYGDQVTVIGTVQNVATRRSPQTRREWVEAILSDGTGAVRLVWFSPWMAKHVHLGAQLSVSGKIDQHLGRLLMKNPDVEALDQVQLSTNRIVPIYPLTSGITQKWLRNVMNQVVSHYTARMPDPLPKELLQSADLVDLSRALMQIHFPASWDDLKLAQERMSFNEIFLLQFGVLGQKKVWQSRTARIFETPSEWLEQIIQGLPFELTDAQKQSLQDVRQDLASGRPMNRLLQGDVGSGKTIVAALAIAMVARFGAQAALMAPTGILADQHFTSMLRFLVSSTGIMEPGQIRLLVGATPEAEKREILAGLADGTIKLVIGTHALIEDPITFADLELTIVDEQHRFGVEQRALLRSKGTNPHLLVMTATPIPRSLALTIYGDLDLSVIDQMPPGRQPVGTYVLPPLERERAYRLIRSQVEAGCQAFIIYPLVEESEKSDSPAAVEEQTRLQTHIFPDLKIGLLHGRMRADEKDEVMLRFRDGEYHILVSTTVVEVGVDIPNATVMLIEGANRFGLAQLHQLRGRVGRGEGKSYCLLIPESTDAVENERLQVMVQTNDGFELAEHDLRQRGPGEFLGTRQAGYSDMQLANLTNVPLIDKARRHAQALFEADPDLQEPEHKLLADYLAQSWDTARGDIS